MQIADLEKAKGKCPCGERYQSHFHTGKMVTRQAPVSAEIEKISQACLAP
jgi:hypothetical protein